MLERQDKEAFKQAFCQVESWFGDYAQYFLVESQGLLRQANDSTQRK